MKKILIVNFTAIYIFVNIITTSMQNVYAASWVIVPSMLATFLENAMWTTAFIYSGYSYLHDDVTVSELMDTSVYKKHMSDNSQALRDWLADNPSVSPNTLYHVNDNVTVSVDSNGKAQVGLSNSLIKNLVADMKEYCGSLDNAIDMPLSSDIAGEVSCNNNVKSIKTQVIGLDTYSSITDIDEWAGEDGISDYMYSLGYTDADTYIVATQYGSNYYFLPLRMNESYGYNMVSSNVYNGIMKNVYSNALEHKVQSVYSSEYNSYVSEHTKTRDCIVFDMSDGTFDTITYVHNFFSYGFSNLVAFNYNKAYEQNCRIKWSELWSFNYTQKLYTPVAAVNNIVLNPALAPSLDNSGYQYFSATAEQMETDYSTIDALIDAYTDLTDNLADWQQEQTANQEQIIAQQTSILAGVNTVIDVLADGFADVIAAVDAVAMDIVTAVDSIAIDLDIPQSLDVALPATFWIDLEAVLADAFADMDITNDIVVTNDYAGLSDLLYELFYGLMSDLFMPNWDNFNMRVAVFESKFKWVDDLKNFIDELANIFNVQPSPKLIISLPAKKNGLDFGLKEFVLDVSWYADYKKTGDVIILAFIIAIFAWRLYLKLPSIINGNGVTK